MCKYVVLSFLRRRPCRRYKLLNPAPGYASAHAPIQRKLDLCGRSAALMCQPQLAAVPLDKLASHILATPGLAGTSTAVYSLDDLAAEAGFMVGQLASIAKVGSAQLHCLGRHLGLVLSKPYGCG